jgi:hypothetical protein
MLTWSRCFSRPKRWKPSSSSKRPLPFRHDIAVPIGKTAGGLCFGLSTGVEVAGGGASGKGREISGGRNLPLCGGEVEDVCCR